MCKCLKVFVVSIFMALSVGALSALASGNIGEGYGQLVQPWFAPPAGLFPVVWTILYILMGISAGLIYCSNKDPEDKGEALSIYAFQLFLNFGWSILFFGLEMRLAAFFWLILMILAIAVMILRFARISKAAAYLQIPYLLWSMFAAVLNLSVYLLNR